MLLKGKKWIAIWGRLKIRHNRDSWRIRRLEERHRHVREKGWDWGPFKPHWTYSLFQPELGSGKEQRKSLGKAPGALEKGSDHLAITLSASGPCRGKAQGTAQGRAGGAPSRILRLPALYHFNNAFHIDWSPILL